MPEGDGVGRAAPQLHGALAGRVLLRSDFRVPRYATVSLAGRVVTESVSRGKHLLTRVDGDITVHTHLKMEGSWRVGPATGYPPRDHRVRGVLANDTSHAEGQQRGLGAVLRTRRESRAVGHLGTDLLGPDWDAQEAVRRLAANPERAIGEAIMDQRNLAGIGNLYKAETLFLRGVNPWRPAAGVPAMPELVELAQRMLEANKERVGQVTTGNPARGEQNWVYGRAAGGCGPTPRRAHRAPSIEEGIPFGSPRCQL